ncbi:MAG TPA: beta-ketoacyl synthase, partial [Tenacibaculum sp.]|nr:beta-ketoacyl synthase [Tenacibaculum sp.]
MNKKISITSIGSISALGSSHEKIWNNYKNDKHFLKLENYENFEVWIAKISEEDKQFIEKIRYSDTRYKNLDNSVLYALFAARKAIQNTDWQS